MRIPLEELLRTDDPAWPSLRAWLAAAGNPAAVWTTPRSQGEQAILALQAPASSTLGALALHTAGVSIDHGWLRLLGAGGERLVEGLVAWNGLSGGTPALPGALVVAHDAIGGIYAVNGGAFSGQQGLVHHLSARTGSWMELGLGYTRFVQWCLQGDLERFYGAARWSGWREDLRTVEPDEGICFYPHLWTHPRAEGLEQRQRSVVPMRVLWELLRETWDQRHARPAPEA